MRGASAVSSEVFAIDPSEFRGRRVLVSGGTQGIGAALVQRFALGGARVATCARSAHDQMPQEVMFVPADLGSAAGTQSVVQAIQTAWGGVDVLVNCVGGSSAPSGGFAVLDDGQWQKALDMNLLVAVRLDRAFVPGMLARGWGVVVHVSSIQRKLPLPQSTTAYAAAKAALTTYSKALSKEVGPKGVRVNSVAPGGVNTDAATRMVREMAAHAGVDEAEAWQELLTSLGGVPIGRFAEPQEVAELVAFIASPRASAIHGAEYVIDGGTIDTV